MNPQKIRKISQIIRGQNTSDGAGVKLKRVLGSSELNMLDPFLLLDEFKNDDPNDYSGGFPDHPHRGFETITYMMAGSFTHRDSKGHEGHLTAGSVQWMTAGRGLIHSEMPEQADGLAWGYQLWLNLPAKLKMIEPKYQDIPSEKLPVVEKDGARVKILSGSYGEKESPAKSFYPFTYLDVELKPGSTFTYPAPQDQNTFLYVFQGKAKTGAGEEPSTVKTGYLGVFGEGDSVQVESADEQPLRFLFASAQKLNEPVARGGPFVMNTPGEIKQAFLDYQMGRFA